MFEENTNTFFKKMFIQTADSLVRLQTFRETHARTHRSVFIYSRNKLYIFF